MMDARTENSGFKDLQGGMSPEEIEALMQAHDYEKATAFVRRARRQTKAAKAQNGYRKRQQAKGRDQFSVTTTIDPLKRGVMRRCIKTIECDEFGAAALEAVLDDPAIAALAREIRSGRRPRAADNNNNPEASGPDDVTDLVRALLDDIQLCDLVHELLKCDRAAVSAIARALASPYGPQLVSGINEIGEEELAGLLTVLHHHQRGPLLKHCARHGVGVELLTGIYHPEAPALGRRLQELPRFWRWLFDRLTARFR